MMGLPSTERFSSRVEDYRRYRPRYPIEIVDLLEHECGLCCDSLIADIAAGTGLLAEIFLARGYAVTAVEPNERMRAVCEALVSHYLQLNCLSGTAEETGLSAGSTDLILVGQAMHWFDLKRARPEFARILKPFGWCVVIYNERHLGGDEFHEGYEKILDEFGMDYRLVQRRHLDEDRLSNFFRPRLMKRCVRPNWQDLDLETLMGRLSSSSYMPQHGGPRFDEMRAAAQTLFARCEKDGRVRMKYDCAVSYGQLG